MDNVKGVDTTQIYKDRINELFKELASTELYDAWADAFDIDLEDDSCVTVVYHGTQSIKKFKKECKKILFSCICTVMGEGYKIKIVNMKHFNALSPTAKKNIKAFKFFVIGMIFVCIAFAVVVVICSYIGNRSFRETFYSTSSIKIDSSIRVVQLSDLHATSYGDGNERLLERVNALKPDIILCTGDIINSSNDEENVIKLAEGLSQIAVSYYVYGSNEIETVYGVDADTAALDEKALYSLDDTFEEKLENTGMQVLKNEMDTVTVKNMKVDVYGILTTDSKAFAENAEKSFEAYAHNNTDNLKITAVHNPSVFQSLSKEFWGDLMVCGYTHGGVVRIPVLGPMYTPDAGFLPQRKGGFVYGRYDCAGKPLIVSGGLENSNVLRINNQPELVVIDINKF